MPHLSLRSFRGHKKSDKEDKTEADVFDQDNEYVTSPSESKLHILKFEDGQQSFWQRAWEETKEEAGVELPVDFHQESVVLKDEVEQIAVEARLRAQDTADRQHRIPGTKFTYRQVYDDIANWANKFTDVGDLIVQGDKSGYASLPWSMIRFVIKVLVRESDTYHSMLEGTQFVAQLVTQYPIIERTYARVDSYLATALRKSLYELYVAVLRFQINATKYFDKEKKFFRTWKGVNPVSSDQIKQSREAINGFKDQVDRDIALVHSDVTKRGLDVLIEENDTLLSGQRELLSLTKDGILALSEETDANFRLEHGFLEEQFGEAETRNQKRNEAMLDMWRGPLNAMSAKLEQEKVQQEKDDLLKLRQWLSEAQPETDFNDAEDKRKMPLGDWLVQHERYTNWKCNEHSALIWMFGFAGTGKTGLICRVIKDLRQSLAKGRADRIAFFFCSNNQVDLMSKKSFSRSDPEEALRSIVSRLSTSQRTRSAATVVQNMYEEFGPHSDTRRTLDSSDCVEVIVALAREVPIFIVIDAFDELNQEKSPVLLQHLKSIIDRGQKTVKIFISTRSFPAIKDELQPEQTIEVTTEHNGGDVRTFIHKTIQDRVHDGSLKVSSTLQGEIEDTLATRSRNMFLYANLQLTQICDRNSNDDEGSIRKKLNNLPQNLSAVYEGILDQIHDDKSNSERSCKLAQETFKWLLQTQEILLCDSLLQAISPAERHATIDEIVHACRTLVVQAKVSDRLVFEFAHYSVREYVSKMEQYSPSKCHAVVLKGCLRALNATSVVPRQNGDTSETQNLFLEYALLYWPLHYENINRQIKNEHRADINTALRNFLLQGRSTTNKYADWIMQAQRMVKRLRDDKYLSSKLIHIEATPPTPLFAACVFGIDDLIGNFGRELNGLDKRNAQGQTALSLAIENNNLDVVQALISRRYPASINLLNIEAVRQFEDLGIDKKPEVVIYASALQCAAATGHLEIAQLLIRKGAHIDLIAGHYGSPLQAAALNGHSELVSLLLKQGAEPNSQGGFCGNALQAAAAEGHSNIINVLLENEPPAHVDVPGGHYGSALMAAICSGNVDTVWALLEEKAQTSLRSKKYGLPLERATDMGQASREIVSLLLNNNAEADLSHVGTEFHLLHKAAMYNMIDLAEYCLKPPRSCQIDMVTTEGPRYPRRYGDFAREMTPLGFACAEGHVDMVDFLLSHGAPYELDKPKSAPLWTAAYQGHARVIDLLLTRFKAEHSKDVNHFLLKRPDPKSGHPILFAAASSGKPDAVRVLLDHGAKYEANWFSATPLLATATFRCPEVTEVLLEYHRNGKIDAQIDMRAKHGRTALIEACALNRQRVVELLLNAGADYTVTDNDNGSALHFSVDHNDENLCRLLVNRALSDGYQRFLDFVNIRNKISGRTALVDCAAKNKPAAFEMLLKAGADYNIAGHFGNNPLLLAVTSGYNGLIETLLDKIKSDYKNQPVLFYEYVNRQNKNLNTALYCASECNHPSTVKLLLEAGADYRISNKNQQTILNPACWNGHKAVVKTVLDFLYHNASSDDIRQFLNHRNRWGITAIYEACTKKTLETVDLLLARGCDYTIPSESGDTTLHAACSDNGLAVVQHLLKFAARNTTKEQLLNFINQTNNEGRTALWNAVDQKNTQTMQLLLERGADYTIPKKNNVTILHKLCFTKNLTKVEILINFITGNSTQPQLHDFLNRRNYSLKTALIDACEVGDPFIPRLLLDLGADYTIPDKNGFTALHYCAWRDHRSTVSALLDKISPDHSSSDPATRAKFSAFINRASTSNHRTALCDVAVKQYGHFVRVLLDLGADWDCPDNKGRDPAHWACRQKSGEIFRMLVMAAGLGDCDNVPAGEERRALEERFFHQRDKDGESVLEAGLRHGVIRDEEVPKLVLMGGK